MREMFVGAKEGRGEDGATRRFDYYVLIDEMEVDGGFACESYGAKIAEQGGDTAAMPNVTTSISRIDGLMELLTRNLVTPASLEDVMADWL